MPLFVFLVLGLMQLGLLHQARLMAKYAAFKAVRVGAIHNAKMSSMKRAAMAVMLPMMGRRSTPSFFNATQSKFAASWAIANGQLDSSGANAPLDITICEPYGNVSGDFDDPYGGMGMYGSWEQLNKGRLAIQLTVNYQLVIPFANGVIWTIVRGQERAELLRNLRLAPMANDTQQKWMDDRKRARDGKSRTVNDFTGLADGKVYVLPIRTSWAMRMHSNFFASRDGFKLPAKNECYVPWQAPGM